MIIEQIVTELYPNLCRLKNVIRINEMKLVFQFF